MDYKKILAFCYIITGIVYSTRPIDQLSWIIGAIFKNKEKSTDAHRYDMCSLVYALYPQLQNLNENELRKVQELIWSISSNVIENPNSVNLSELGQDLDNKIRQLTKHKRSKSTDGRFISDPLPKAIQEQTKEETAEETTKEIVQQTTEQAKMVILPQSPTPNKQTKSKGKKKKAQQEDVPVPNPDEVAENKMYQEMDEIITRIFTKAELGQVKGNLKTQPKIMLAKFAKIRDLLSKYPKLVEVLNKYPNLVASVRGIMRIMKGGPDPISLAVLLPDGFDPSDLDHIVSLCNELATREESSPFYEYAGATIAESLKPVYSDLAKQLTLNNPMFRHVSFWQECFLGPNSFCIKPKSLTEASMRKILASTNNKLLLKVIKEMPDFRVWAPALAQKIFGFPKVESRIDDSIDQASSLIGYISVSNEIGKQLPRVYMTPLKEKTKYMTLQQLYMIHKVCLEANYPFALFTPEDFSYIDTFCIPHFAHPLVDLYRMLREVIARGKEVEWNSHSILPAALVYFANRVIQHSNEKNHFYSSYSNKIYGFHDDNTNITGPSILNVARAIITWLDANLSIIDNGRDVTFPPEIVEFAQAISQNKIVGLMDHTGRSVEYRMTSIRKLMNPNCSVASIEIFHIANL